MYRKLLIKIDHRETFVSEIISTSTLSLIYSESNSNLFRIKLMFKWAKISLLRLSLPKDFKVLLQSLTLLMSCKTLVLHPSMFILELLLATRQLKTLEIWFTKVRLKIFEPFLFKWSLPLLRWFGFIFFEWSIRYIFLSWHNWHKIRLTSHLFAFNFELSVLRIILETLTCYWLFFKEVAGSFTMTSDVGIKVIRSNVYYKMVWCAS